MTSAVQLEPKREVMAPRDLRPLFDPRSVAVAGASLKPGKWGNRIAEQFARAAHRRPFYFVNRRGGTLYDQRVYRTVRDLPEVPELLAVCVPSEHVEETVELGLELGTRAFVVLAAGFGELGRDAFAREQALVARVRAAGSLLLGPNCLGVSDAQAEFECIPWTRTLTGQIGLITQSGSLAMDLDQRLRSRGALLGFSRVAAVGNQADVTVAELIHDYAEHEQTNLIAIYCEDLIDGRRFFEAAHAAWERGVHVILMAAVQSEAAAEAAQSHTGALVSPRSALDAAAKAAGVFVVDTPRQLIIAAEMLANRSPRAGKRVAVVSEGGGFNVFGAGSLTQRGLALPRLAVETQAAIRNVVPAAAAQNPVDLVGVETSEGVAGVAREIGLTSEVDGAMFTVIDFGFLPEDVERNVGTGLARNLADKAAAVVVYETDGIGAQSLRRNGVPVYRDAEDAAFGLSCVLGRREPAGLPVLPARRAAERSFASYFGARRLLAEHGVAFAPADSADDVDGAIEAAERMGYPVVVKALGALHKSDVGGVALGLQSAAAVADAVKDMTERLNPPEFSIERMEDVEQGLELIVGTKRDSRLGPLALAGLGGIFAEALSDTAEALAPLTTHAAVDLIRCLRARPLLDGGRGLPALDLEAAAGALVAVAGVAATYPDVLEIEVNPLLVLPQGATALDARIVLRD